MAGKQIEFGKNQRHSRTFELALWGICAVCIIFVLIAIQTVGGGGL
ncbi:MAG: hypothetical protein GY724_03905 [Actinomycetia bacterium]|nr:hypothetical protein [Actinomycetes bacterium]MCP4224106.1 hypothetical protein [Actinomycetes bacterium]MCP5034400.1 hypothetical protein [Actinomycetes bacterium]